MTALHISFQDWVFYIFENNGAALLIVASMLGLASLGYAIFMLISPFLRRHRDIVYYVTTERFMKINFNTETIKYMELNYKLDIYVKEEIKYILVRYMYPLPEYSPGEVYEIGIKGITMPGKLLQTMADQNAAVSGVVV